MAAWLSEMVDIRHELMGLGEVISDHEMAEVILIGVAVTHRDVIRQFSRVMAASSAVPPSLEQVTNTLKSETELDQILHHEDETKTIISVSQDHDEPGKVGDKSGANARGRKKGRFFKRKPGKCNYCHKPCHWFRE